MPTLPIDAVDSTGGQESLKVADIIHTHNRESDDYVQLWGQHIVPMHCPPGQPAHLIKLIEIPVTSSSDVERARAAVERAKRC